VLLQPDPFLRLEVELEPILHLGPTPYGDRRIVPIAGGRFDGPRLRGRIVPGGADWQIVRADGVADIEARYTLETEAGERILVRSEGLRHGPEDAIAALARGEPVDPAAYYFRTIIRFETGAPALAWMNRILTVARGAREPTCVRLDVFEVL
jgi:Protein of unknown function (DUF3237)